MDINKNINWINAVKAISMIAVFWVHCQLYYSLILNNVNNYIHPFYVNAFFFVSGYLLFRKQLSSPIIDENFYQYIKRGGKNLLENGFCRLVYPSILFAIIEFLPKKILRGGHLVWNEFLWETIGGNTYWFTSALFVAQIILLLILITRCRKIWIYWSLSLASLFLGMYMTQNNVSFLGLSHDLWQVKSGLYATAFLGAGGLYWRYEKLFNKLNKKLSVLFMLIIYVVLFTFKNNELHVLISMHDVNWSGYFAGCFASIMIIEICKLLPRIKILTFIGQNSISFYFMSGALPIVMSIVVNHIIGVSKWYGLLVVFLLSMFIAYVITKILNRYLPWVFDFRQI